MALVKDINCREAVSLVGDYLEGRLPRRERRRLERHLAACDACRAYLEQMGATIALTGQVGPEDLSEKALDDLMDVFERFRREGDEGTSGSA
jgi:anti-sigma factor RsiW